MEKKFSSSGHLMVRGGGGGGGGGGKKSSLTRHLHLSVSTQPASRTPLQVSAKYAAGVATFSENVTTQLKPPINSFRLLCDRMGKFRLTH